MHLGFHAYSEELPQRARTCPVKLLPPRAASWPLSYGLPAEQTTLPLGPAGFARADRESLKLTWVRIESSMQIVRSSYCWRLQGISDSCLFCGIAATRRTGRATVRCAQRRGLGRPTCGIRLGRQIIADELPELALLNFGVCHSLLQI